MKKKRGSVRVWSKEDEELLLTMKDEGYREEEICEALGRSRSSIVCRLTRLGYYRNAHAYTRRALPSERPAALTADEAMRAAYRMLGMRDLEYNPRGEKAELPLTAKLQQSNDGGCMGGRTVILCSDEFCLRIARYRLADSGKTSLPPYLCEKCYEALSDAEKTVYRERAMPILLNRRAAG